MFSNRNILFREMQGFFLSAELLKSHILLWRNFIRFSNCHIKVLLWWLAKRLLGSLEMLGQDLRHYPNICFVLDGKKNFIGKIVTCADSRQKMVGMGLLLLSHSFTALPLCCFSGLRWASLLAQFFWPKAMFESSTQK